jgi:endonuclease-3
MAASNRATLIGKLHTALKKKYEVPPAQPARPLLEHLLYACLLEDCPADLADEGLAKCEQDYFDWNEVRVTTATELSQVLSRLPDPIKAATRLKNNLQSVFEEFYTFDLDHMKKENMGKAISKFQKMPSMTPFVLNYTVQHGLGGHAIPVDYSAMVILLSTGIASQAEAQSGKVPGIERAIPKSKGIEFSALLHQAAVALNKDTKDKTARATMDAVDKSSSKRLDEWIAAKRAAKRRAVKKKAEEKAAAEAAAIAAVEEAKKQKRAAAAAARKAAEKAAARAAAKAAPKPAAKKPTAAPKAAAKPAAKKSAKSAAKSKATKKVTKKTAAAGKTGKKAAAKRTAKKATKKTTKKKSASKKTASKNTTSKRSAKKKTKSSKKSSNRKLTKRKPR